MNILEEANNIVFLRSEEKQRQYGSFQEGMHKASRIASEMTGKEITTEDMFKCMIALKLSRESYNHKYDNLLDAIAYLSALNEYHNEKTK
jgi:glycerol-3-phosphate acyltransferase PlsY